MIEFCPTRQNFIHSIEDDEGNIPVGQEDICKVFSSHFRRLWNADRAWGCIESDLPRPILSPDNAQLLVKDVDEEEISKAVFSLPIGNAPGIDGFGASFFRSYWSIIKVVKAVRLFFDLYAKWKKTVIPGGPPP